MSDDKNLIQKFFEKSFPKEKDEEKINKKEIKIAIPPKLRQTFFGQKLDTRRVEEYERTVRAYEGVVRATGDLEGAVEDLNNIDIRIDRNKNRFLAELKESGQRLEDLYKNDELREEQRKADIMEQKLKQAKAEAEIMECEAKKAGALAKKAEEEARAKKATEPPPQYQRPKTRVDKINELEKEIGKIRKAFTEMLQRNKKAIGEEGRLRGLTDQEIEAKKDIEEARLSQIEMEEIEKLERKYR